MTLGLIWAQARERIIGAAGSMPWHVPEDLERFQAITTGTTVIMGRSTWESFPERPLPRRRNIVLTRNTVYEAPGAELATDLGEAIRAAGSEAVWILGGESVYAEAIGHADILEVTDLDLEVTGDTRAPAIDPERWVVASRDPDEGWHRSRADVAYRFTTYLSR